VEGGFVEGDSAVTVIALLLSFGVGKHALYDLKPVSDNYMAQQGALVRSLN